MPCSLTEKPWETGWLGKPVFGLTLASPLPDADALRGELSRLPSPALVTARVDATDHDASALLEHSGFVLIEAYLTLARAVPADAAPDARMRDALPSDADALGELASASFSKDRFHRDPQIADARADRSRRLWVQNALRDERKNVIVAEIEGGVSGRSRIGGFLIARVDDADTHVLDLMAVACSARRRGIGRGLTKQFFFTAKRAGASRVRVGTQDVNTPSLNLYIDCGFRHERVAYSFHLHL